MSFLSPAGILSWFCPWYVVGKNAEQVGDTCVLYALLDLCCFTVGVPLVGILLRASMRWKIREYKGIEGNFIKDCLLHYFCGPCALAQEARVRTHASVVV